MKYIGEQIYCVESSAFLLVRAARNVRRQLIKIWNITKTTFRLPKSTGTKSRKTKGYGKARERDVTLSTTDSFGAQMTFATSPSGIGWTSSSSFPPAAQSSSWWHERRRYVMQWKNTDVFKISIGFKLTTKILKEYFNWQVFITALDCNNHFERTFEDHVTSWNDHNSQTNCKSKITFRKSLKYK